MIMKRLNPGDKAPDFKGIDQNGNELSLLSFKGKKLALYFYPKDNTPGCTAEACNLKDNFKELKEMGVEILGVSADSQKSHANFSAKHALPFDLLADTEKEVIKAYGVWGEKKNYGKVYEGIHRMTFIISEDGIIEHVIEKVKTKDHANQIIDLLKK